MALIKCPECGKEISDKSNVCIHCGFPLQEIIDNQQNELYDVIVTAIAPKFVTNSVASKISGMLKLNQLTIYQELLHLPVAILKGLKKENAEYIKNILLKNCCDAHIEESSEPINTEIDDTISDIITSKNAPVSCPRCKSTQVVTGQRGFSLVTGFIGSNKPVNRCSKCGWTWNP